MKKFRLLSLIILLLINAHIFTPVAAAHPLGNFTINQYAGLHFSQENISIDYVLDMAEIPAYQEIAAFDANGNGQADDDEVASYHPNQCQALRAGLDLRLNSQPIVLNLDSSAVEFPPGAGGLPTLRLTCAFQASIAPVGEKVLVEFKNNLYPGRLGWREIVVTSNHITLPDNLATLRQSISRRLTAYPDDLLTNPLDQREISFNFSGASDSSQLLAQPGLPGAPANPLISTRNDAFTQLILLEDLGLFTYLSALVVAFVWGAMHALTPGHGKTIVAAYLVGSRGTLRHALLLGLTTTITHTAGVFILGFLTLFASRFVLPEQLYPWLGVLSGLLLVWIGLSLFRGRLRGLMGRHPVMAHHHPHDHDHPLLHSHERDPYHPHHHDGFGDHTHSHLPPGADNARVTWRGLLALGVSGGLIPCPSALIVMLSAIALQRIGFGLALILAFSLGLAGVLTAIGVVWVQARQWFEYMPAKRYFFRGRSGVGRLLQLLPAASASFITIVGVGITLQALAQTGLLS
jgi:ABC-type nickel/cobalt efflux system permease component RcnA